MNFVTFEDALDVLRGRTGIAISTGTRGALHLLGSLGQDFNTTMRGSHERCVTVLPDPAQNLSFPYVDDELRIALTTRDGVPPSDELLHQAAERFKVSPLLRLPTASLSGGQRMLVSLCKASLLADSSHTLVLCCPYFWLDQANRHLVRDLLDTTKARETLLLTLAGEALSTDGPHLAPWTLTQELKWSLTLQAPLSVTFPSQSQPRTVPERSIRYTSTTTALPLVSPTLLSGPNGVGKTTLARVLAGLLRPGSGAIKATVNGATGRARLMLQDSVVQLFGQSINEHLARVFKHDNERRKKALSLFEQLQSDCLTHLSEAVGNAAVLDRQDPHTLLQCKLALVAERLLSGSPLLILDEPGWCLSRPVAQAFLRAVITAAHLNGIAVVVITHQSHWWRDLLRSELALSWVGEHSPSTHETNTDIAVSTRTLSMQEGSR